MKQMSSLARTLLLVAVVLAFSLSGPAQAADPVKLPKMLLWSCYDMGSTGYVHASAMADALLKKYGVRTRLMPSGTSIGRLTPLTQKRVEVGWLATEAFFAAEGLYDFATYDWGPQDLRTILALPADHAVITTKESGIKTLYDLKGKRVSWIPGNPSLNVKMTAYLAFANLSWDDVKKVEFPGYADTMRGLIAGTVDAVCGTATASLAYELASTPKGVYYPPFPTQDKAGWKRMLQVAPFLAPHQATIGADIVKEKPIPLVRYRYPVGTVYADASEEYVYNLVKALDEAFPLYEKAHPTMYMWAIKYAGLPPADCPFHNGAIKYFKETGIWTAEHQTWNDAQVARIKKLKAAWPKAVAEGKAKNMTPEQYEKFWEKERVKVLGD